MVFEEDPAQHKRWKAAGWVPRGSAARFGGTAGRLASACFISRLLVQFLARTFG
jgi:hypothetical protein